jgi:outer membrane protein assembly factor BamE (lipoprotein component of BamABCDE complex)
MGRLGRGFAAALAALVALSLAGCTPIVRNHGYVPSDEDLAQIVVGVDTRDSVAAKIGRPSAAGVINPGGFYYVRSTFRTVAWRAPEEIERQLVAITFAPDGTVANIERFGLEDGRVITLSRRVTSSSVQNLSFIRQLLGNIGRVRLGDAPG